MRIDVGKLKAARLERGMSQEDAAGAAGISARTLQRVETGYPPSLETARALAAMFEGVGVDVRTHASKLAGESEAGRPRSSTVLRWARGGIVAGSMASFCGIVVGVAQGSMTSAELGAALGLLGLFAGSCFVIVDILNRKLHQ